MNLVPSLYGALFYGRLAAGQAVLAVGVAGRSMHSSENVVNAASVAVILASLCLAAESTSAAPLSMSAMAAITSPGPGMHAAAAAPELLMHTGTWVLVSTALMVTSISFVRACFRSGGDVRHMDYLGLLILFYGVGTLCSVQIPMTGSQFWHVPTAAASLSGFVVQLVWLRNMMKSSDIHSRWLEGGVAYTEAAECSATASSSGSRSSVEVTRCSLLSSTPAAQWGNEKFPDASRQFSAPDGDLRRGSIMGQKPLETSGTVSSLARR